MLAGRFPPARQPDTSLMPPDPVYADLHAHTSCSDGERAPAELVELAEERGLRILAVTDHDTVGGVAEAEEAARSRPLAVLTGVELSVTLGGEELHLLAYGVDPSHSGLTRHLQAMQQVRRERAWEMIERLRAEGLEVADARLREQIASTHAVGRPHVAAALVRAGHVQSNREAFDRFLGRDGPGFVAKPAFAAEDALGLVHETGGVGVLAHPGHWTSGRQVRRLVEAGLDGLETIHPSHDASLQGYYERLARGHDLLVTGGSDYHGRTPEDEERFGRMGLSRADWERFQAALA